MPTSMVRTARDRTTSAFVFAQTSRIAGQPKDLAVAHSGDYGDHPGGLENVARWLWWPIVRLERLCYVQPRIHVYTPYGSSPLADDISTQLRATGADVSGPGDDLPSESVGALVVMLADDMHAARDHELEQHLAPWASVVVPVVPGRTASATFPDLAHMRAGSIGAAHIARRIEQIARFGGATLAALARLEATAAQWVERGRPGALLARGARVDADLNTVTAAAGLASAEAIAYVRAGADRRRRRTRGFLATAVAVACVLTAGTGIAASQRMRAVQATEEAQQQAADADSARLARLAVQAEPIDPDLPWLLTQQALERSRTPQALDAARRVLTTTPIHRTIALPTLPIQVSADPVSDSFTVWYVDGSVDLRSGADGRVLREFPAGTGTAVLFPGGEVIYLGEAFVDVASGRTLRKLDPGWGVSRLGWSDKRARPSGRHARGPQSRIGRVGDDECVALFGRLRLGVGY